MTILKPKDLPYVVSDIDVTHKPIRREEMKTKCPHDQGFYIKTIVSGKIRSYFNNDGSYDADSGMNSSMHDDLDYHDFKTKFCTMCNKRIGTMKESTQ
jgi:hypothetical protein